MRQHPTSFSLPFGEGVRGWGKFKLTNTFSTSSRLYGFPYSLFDRPNPEKLSIHFVQDAETMARFVD